MSEDEISKKLENEEFKPASLAEIGAQQQCPIHRGILNNILRRLTNLEEKANSNSYVDLQR